MRNEDTAPPPPGAQDARVATDDDILIPENHVEFFSFKSGQLVAFIHIGGGSAEINISAVD